jgi:SAM-dependent methyltransferase
MPADLAGRLAARYPTRFLRSYVRAKLRSDPVYEAVAERLSGNDDPLLDLGCGAGVLPAFLRERGFTAPMRGVDHDERKIAVARRVVPGVAFECGDVRRAVCDRGTVVMLDVLHYFPDSDRTSILENAAAHATTVIIRSGVRDASWRYRVTYAQETFARLVRWLRAERLNFPARESIERHFRGFAAEVVPMRGHMPFNNYLFVFRRSSEGMTNE